MKERSNLPSRSVVWLATAALLLFSYFIAALLLLHVLRPDYTIADHMISDYAIGAFDPIMTSAFLSISLGCLALATGLLRIGPKSWLGRASAGLLIVAFAGLIVTAVFPTDLETAASTRTGDIHNISFLVNIVSIMLSSICLSLSYTFDPQWKRHRVAALALAGVLLLAFVAQYLTLHRGAPYGITNRLFVAVLMVWLLSNSLWLKAAASIRLAQPE
ncbi:DUF998 domain-containing protein [Sphingopyxis sp. SE2]|uniref:DUF998 domain-containing protein n=2 Tax=Pseudomonadota TaxID=1224 RepID=UPI0028C26A12|nr:DUF998 domain-containing protein [Sphingopyxis sp. SE2]MDT7531574.1 DUF998 domain-containing protein [Sphingopyxis sp. SE2]